MRSAPLVRLATAAALLYPGVAHAHDYVLDYTSTLTLAATRAPDVIAAAGVIDAARGRRAASTLANPELDVEAGPRLRDGAPTTTDVAVGLSQAFELGGQRGARRDGARATVDHAIADADDARRLARRDAGLAYYRAVLAAERVTLAERSAAVATELQDLTARRQARGEAVALDVNLARATAARARAALRTAHADREDALGALRALLALEPTDTLAVRGDLAARAAPTLDALLAAAHRRPELRALDARRAEGAALAAVGDAQAWPSLTLGVRYEREEQADIVLGGVTITLPTWDRGHGDRREGRAIATHARLARDAHTRAIDATVRAAFAAYTLRRAAVDDLVRDVAPLLDANDSLLGKAYAAGQLSLADTLVARRELDETRRDVLEHRFALAVAAVELDAAAGVVP